MVDDAKVYAGLQEVEYRLWQLAYGDTKNLKEEIEKVRMEIRVLMNYVYSLELYVYHGFDSLREEDLK